MQYALSAEGIRIEAAKGSWAKCPLCLEPVIPRCGAIKVHHWAHVAVKDCDPWHEAETQWHRSWKFDFPIDQVEVVMGEHRADIRTSSGLVIELQNSAISWDEIVAREEFYGRMIWILNASKFADRFFVLKRMNEQVFSFKWKQMKPSWRFANSPIYFDFGKTSLKDLLAARYQRENEWVYERGQDEATLPNQIERYDGPVTRESPKGYLADPQFEALSEQLQNCSLFRVMSLHENGFGSIKPIHRGKFLDLHGSR